jgi:D-3-phosphoglycerate dehydrogenase
MDRQPDAAVAPRTSGSRRVKRVVLIANFDRSVDMRFDRLSDFGLALTRRPDLAGTGTEEQLIQALDGAWAVIAGNERYTSRVLASVRDLRVIARPGVGYDGVDVAAATEHGTAVFTTPGTNHETVADLTIGLMLTAVRRIALMDRTIRTGGWRTDGLAHDLHSTSVGVVGLGLIGRAVVRRLTAFGCQILASEPNPDLDFCEQYGVRLADLDDFLPDVNVLTLHTLLNPDTHHLIDARRLAKMRSTAILINTSRGAIVDEQALVSVLAAGAIGGAGLDVFETEPLPARHPLTTLANVVLTSHVGSHTTESMTRMIEATIEGIVQALRGLMPQGCLNPVLFQPFGEADAKN